MVNRRRPRNPGGANDTYVCQRNSQGNIYQRGRSGASYALNDVHEVVRLKQLGGRSEREIGGIVKRSQTFVRGVWRRHQRDGGVLLTLRHGGWRRGSVTTGHRAYLLGLLRKYPTKYHRYYRLKLNTHFGRTFSQGQVQRMLKAMGMTRKKITAMMIECAAPRRNRRGPAPAASRPHSLLRGRSLTPWARARQAAFLALIAALKANDPQVRRRLHFVDVSGVDQTTFNARYGMVRRNRPTLARPADWARDPRGAPTAIPAARARRPPRPRTVPHARPPSRSSRHAGAKGRARARLAAERSWHASRPGAQPHERRQPRERGLHQDSRPTPPPCVCADRVDLVRGARVVPAGPRARQHA